MIHLLITDRCQHDTPATEMIDAVRTAYNKCTLTNWPLASGIRTFISEDFAETISVLSESLLRYIMHPSVLSTLIVGTLPSTCRGQQRTYGDHTLIHQIFPMISRLLLKTPCQNQLTFENNNVS